MYCCVGRRTQPVEDQQQHLVGFDKLTRQEDYGHLTRDEIDLATADAPSELSLLK